MIKCIFPDTNVFEHFPPLSDIDWLSLASCDHAVLLIAPVTISELNKHKDTSVRPKLKARATAALSQLSKYARSNPPVHVRERVEIRFCTSEPLIDFSQYQLSPDVPDDRLLASAIEFATRNGLDCGNVLVATADLGLDLKAGSKPQITRLPMPPELRLPDEVDVDTKRIKELEDEIRSLRSIFPQLMLKSVGNSTFAEIFLTKAIFLDESTLLQKVELERNRLPRLQPTTANGPFEGAILSLMMAEPIESYNEKLDKYFLAYENWLRDMAATYAWRRLTPKLKLEIQNTGGAPATDIEIEIHFPDGFEVLQKEQLPKSPKKPSPPLTPEERFKARLAPNFDWGISNYQMPELATAPTSQILSIKKTKSHLLKAWIQEVKHHRTVPVPPVYLHFHSEGSLKSFRISYEILASNYPKKFEGDLDVVLKT